MLRLVPPDRNYEPATITLMTDVIETVCRSAPKLASGNDVAPREAVARAILRYIDQGERDRARLVELATRELAA
jgi:hypothetical protein